MAGSYLLDTNIVIALFNGDRSVADRIQVADEVFLPATVLGELYFGAQNSTQAERNVARIEEILEVFSLLKCEEDTAWEYGLVKAELKKAGRLIPDNDIWIAASARQYDLTVATRDDHFKAVPSLRVETW